MKRELDPSPFSEEINNKGYYPYSIVLKFYLSRGKITFDKLKDIYSGSSILEIID